jgi:tripartite-type tricarboxylate transporter receptor subunit TctC
MPTIRWPRAEFRASMLRALLLLLLVCGNANAFPTKPVRLIVPFPPGGATDIIGRLVAAKMQAVWGQSVIVDNRPGAGTVVGTDLVAKSAPDGHTLGMVVTAHVINPSLRQNLPYDTLKDLAAVSHVSVQHLVIAAHPSVEARNIAELIALAKKNPGKLAYATPGSGTAMHLSVELLKSQTGIDLVHVPYKGISLAVPAVMAGEVQLTFAGIATSMPQLKAGRIKAIAIGGAQRSPLLPQVPTFRELGYPEVETHAWFGFFLPAGSPPDAIARIHRDTKTILEEPEFRQKQLIDKGYDVVGSSPAEFAAYIRKDSESRARAVKISGAKAE